MATLNRPAWFPALAEADAPEQWLAAIINVDEPAVEGLLRKHALPDPILRSSRVEEIGRALADGRLDLAGLAEWRFEVERAIEAVSGIDDFRQRMPIVQAFRAGRVLPGGNLEAILAGVRNAIWRGDLALETWVSFLDSRRDEADFDLFLYRLGPADLQRLAGWTRPAALQDQLRDLGYGEVGADPRFVWMPLNPALVAAGPGPGPDEARFRFVATRRWQQDGGAEQRRRALAFLRIDLRTGAIEVQVQHVERGGIRSLVAERDRYAQFLTSLVGASPEPLRLEPAMRALTTSPRLGLESWKVRLPTGGILAGKHQNDLFARVRPGFDHFYALELTGEWQAAPDLTLTIKIDSRSDAITVREQCAPGRVADLVAFVRGHAAKPEEIPTAGVLGAVAVSGAVETPPPAPPSPTDAKVAELRQLLEKLVSYQRSLGHADMAVDRLASKEAASDLLANPATLQEALDQVGVRYLGATLYVICPRSGKPVQQGGATVEFERLSDIPAEIACENDHGEPRLHATKGNVWLKVGHEASPTTFYAIYVAWILFLVLLALATWFFVWLRETYPEQRGFITAGYALSVLAAIAAIVRLYGRRNVDAAARILELVFSRRLSWSEEPREPPGNASGAPPSDRNHSPAPSSPGAPKPPRAPGSAPGQTKFPLA